jgi:hypothetical protein
MRTEADMLRRKYCGRNTAAHTRGDAALSTQDQGGLCEQFMVLNHEAHT